MRARLAHLWSSLWPDPATTSLGWWLVAIHLGLVLLVGGGISWYASGMLRDLADEQGKARVQLAATTAREDLRRMGEDALATARALADSPTLQRLTAEGQSDALPPFLRRAGEAGGGDACAVLSGKSGGAVSGPALDWQKVLTASAEQTVTFMALPATQRGPLLGARAAPRGAGMGAGVIGAEGVAGRVRALSAAATRLGAGDFSASIPPGGAAEVGALARTMESMRRNLIDLTSTLRRREAEAQAVLSGIVEGVYAVDRNRIIRYLNPQAARLLGVTPEQAVGRFCGDVLQPRNEDGRRPADFRCPILQARSAGSAKAVEHLGSPPGEPRTAVITSSAQVDDLQVQVIRDETELEAVRRARDSVLANISHEFRTPLAAQLASIELLLAGLEHMPAAQQKELVPSLDRGALLLAHAPDH